MTPDPALNPQTEETIPLMMPRVPIAGGRGIGVPLDPVTGQGVRPVACDFDPLETRTYNGVPGGKLSIHAEDIWCSVNNGPVRDGTGHRALDRMEAVLATAVWAYIVVRNALALLAKPIRPKMSERRAAPVHRKPAPKAPTVWLTKPPTEAEWKARDEAAGYDVRGTSPTWVRRRVYQHRARRKRALELPFERTERLARRKEMTARASDFIGPPALRHYEEAQDMGMIWPPVALSTEPKGTLPRISEAEFISDEVRENLTSERVEEADDLIERYNTVLEEFGEDGTCNFMFCLSDDQLAFMEEYINLNTAFIAARGREPP